MAKSLNNITRGLSGMVGKSLVFRNVGNQTIVAAAPVKPGRSSPAQHTHRNRFKMASAYAKAQMNDVVIKTAYANSVKHLPTRTAYHAALTDFLNKPEIIMIDCTRDALTGKSIVRVLAEDDFQVVAMRAEVLATDGHLIESGRCVQQSNGLEWVYPVIRVLNETCIIRIIAYDLPANESVKEIIIDADN